MPQWAQSTLNGPNDPLYGTSLGVNPSYATRQSIFDTPPSSGDGTGSLYGVYGAPVQGSFGDGTRTTGMFANASTDETTAQIEAERDTRIRQLQDMAGAELAGGGAGLAYSPAFAEPQPLPVGSIAPDPSMKSIVPDPQVVARGITADGRAWERWDTDTTAYAVPAPELGGVELPPLSKAEVDALRNGTSSQGGGFLANARAGMNAFWTQVADEGVSQGSFLKYATGQTMRAFGNFGYDVADKVDAAYDQPREGVIGGVKSLINLGPDLFNGTVNSLKLSLDGYSRVAEKLGAGDDTFAGFRQTSPYNVTPLFGYDNQAQAGGGLIAQTALGFGLEKYGDYNIRLNVDTSPTFYTGKPLFTLEAPESGAPTRRLATAGDQQFPTADDALAEALARHGIDPSTVETTPMYGKNPNLLGPKGEPWEIVSGLTQDGRLVEFEHHSNGHFFSDKNEFELPHYHGPNGEHLTY